MKHYDLINLIRDRYNRYKEYGNGALKYETKALYNEYKSLGGTKELKEILTEKTEPYVDKINGEIGVYCIYCQAKLNSKDKHCPDCFREIKEII